MPLLHNIKLDIFSSPKVIKIGEQTISPLPLPCLSLMVGCGKGERGVVWREKSFTGCVSLLLDIG